MIGPSVVGGPTRTPGAKLWRGVIRNPRAVAWISDILDKAKWHRAPPQLSSQLSGATKGHPTLLTSGGVADLSTVDPEVLAQLLSSALYYMAEETELTHIVRLSPHESIGPCILPDCNALLLLGSESRLIHHRLDDGIQEPLALQPGDIVTRRGIAARDCSLHVPPQAGAMHGKLSTHPTARSSTSHSGNRARAGKGGDAGAVATGAVAMGGWGLEVAGGGGVSGGLRRCSRSCSRSGFSLPLMRSIMGASSSASSLLPSNAFSSRASASSVLQERVLFLFKSEGIWPGDPLWGIQVHPDEKSPFQS